MWVRPVFWFIFPSLSGRLLLILQGPILHVPLSCLHSVPSRLALLFLQPGRDLRPWPSWSGSYRAGGARGCGSGWQCGQTGSGSEAAGPRTQGRTGVVAAPGPGTQGLMVHRGAEGQMPMLPPLAQPRTEGTWQAGCSTVVWHLGRHRAGSQASGAGGTEGRAGSSPCPGRSSSRLWWPEEACVLVPTPEPGTLP